MEKKYKSCRIVDGKPKWVIINKTGNIINRKPNKEELKELENDTYTVNFHQPKRYTDKALLDYLIEFYEKNNRIPVRRDFVNDSRYPGHTTYIQRFGSWNEALKLVKMDIDTRTMQGQLITSTEKGRFTEILIREMFDNKGRDISGENLTNTFDGICPTGQIYDVKSSKLHTGERVRWSFNTQNKDKGDDIESIQWYYFIAFNEEYTKILYIWRVPSEIIEVNVFYIGITKNYNFNIENMKQYDITDKCNEIINRFQKIIRA